jgi:hypothetical protein
MFTFVTSFTKPSNSSLNLSAAFIGRHAGTSACAVSRAWAAPSTAGLAARLAQLLSGAAVAGQRAQFFGGQQ